MKIAYVTLLNPCPSGISDWAEELLPYLKDYFDIDTFVPFSPSDVANAEMRRLFKIYSIDDYPSMHENYDKAIFQAGNNTLHKKIMDCFLQFGGILELHDIAMHHYLVATEFTNDKERYLDILRYCHGNNAVNEAKRFFRGERNCLWESEAAKFPAIKHFVDRADSVIVHSETAKQIVKGIAPEKDVTVISLHCAEISNAPLEDYKASRTALGIHDDEIAIVSLGFATPAKRITSILKQLSNLRKFTRKKFTYYIVGENHIPELKKMIADLLLQDYVCVTGKVSLETFNLYCKAGDLYFNLRYPTMYESSASLLRLIGYGKRAVVTDIGSFHDFPDEYVYKIRYGTHEEADILRVLLRFFKDYNGFSEEESLRITSYARENFSLDLIAKSYFEYLSENKQKDSYMDRLLDLVMQFHPYEQNIVEKMIG